jgi:hypothetical protein
LGSGLFSWRKWKRSTCLFESSVRHRTPDFELESGALAFFLQKSVDFPLEKARLFGALPTAPYWQSACQRSFVALPTRQSLNNQGNSKPQFLHIQFPRLLPGSFGANDSAHRLIRKILIDVLFAVTKCDQSERFGTDGQIPAD